jgi:hypothetical protein
MTPKQDKGYWRRWAAVLRAHPQLKALPKDQLDEERHGITLDATKGRTSSHKDVHDNREVTALFRRLEFKAQPNDLTTAMPVANPEEEAEADAQRRAVFALSNKGLTLDEIARIAAPLCRRHRVGSWQRLPSGVLIEMMRWKQFQPKPDAPFIYHLRPSPKTPRPAAAGPF